MESAIRNPTFDIRNVAPALARFNRRWQERRCLFVERAPPPWWAPGLRLTPEVRQTYEAWLPVAAFLADLAGLARLLLPHPAWLPVVLQTPQTGGCCGGGASHAARPASIPDLWADLPPVLAGRVVFEADELLSLLCALASPSRFGTAAGRYPEQTAALCRFAADVADRPLRLLDVGCGTGQGTWELAGRLGEATGGPVHAVGVTREPLEAWMATRRDTPHDRRPERAFPPLQAAVQALFLAGDLAALPLRGRFHLIVANGIVGGPIAEAQGQAGQTWLAEAGRRLAPAGLMSLANHFHEGFRAPLAAFAAEAAAAGWEVSGPPDLLALRPPHRPPPIL